MAIRLGSNKFAYKETPLKSEDLNDTFAGVENNTYNLIANTHLMLLYQGVNSTTQNFKGDVYTDNDGWLNTVDTTNTTADFNSNHYWVEGDVVYSNPAEVTTNSTSFVVVKTFNVDKLIHYITSEIRNAINTFYYIKVRFTDAVGSWESSQYGDHGDSYVSVTLFNPYPERIPTTVEIMLRTGNSTYAAYERNTELFTIPTTSKIVQTNPQSIQSGFQRFVIVATEETSGTGSVTYEVSFDGGVNYQTGLVSSQVYEIENPGTSLILKQNLNSGDSPGVVKTYDWGILLLK